MVDREVKSISRIRVQPREEEPQCSDDGNGQTSNLPSGGWPQGVETYQPLGRISSTGRLVLSSGSTQINSGDGKSISTC